MYIAKLYMKQYVLMEDNTRYDLRYLYKYALSVPNFITEYRVFRRRCFYCIYIAAQEVNISPMFFFPFLSLTISLFDLRIEITGHLFYGFFFWIEAFKRGILDSEILFTSYREVSLNSQY